MRYELAFRYNRSGPFSVIASAIGSPATPMTGHYKDDETFLRLVNRANLASDEYARVVYAIMVAVAAPETHSCREEVSLDMQQLNVLQLNGSSRQVA
jgi:hypothetical protein